MRLEREAGAGVVNAAEAKCFLREAGDYLVRMSRGTGTFVYQAHSDPEVAYEPEYNLLRHAGTMYALAGVAAVVDVDGARVALQRAQHFLTRACITPLPGEYDLLAVWSYPDITQSGRFAVAKLGGTGLGLVALTSVERAWPGSVPRPYMTGLARFLDFMQKDNGGFFSMYLPQRGGRWDEWESLYYPGEACLGLVQLYELDNDPRWLETAAAGIAYLVRKRQDQQQVPPDHWALLATARLLPHYEKSGQPVPERAVIRHARQICTSMLARQKPHDPDDVLHGCFTSDGRTCPTATDLEGLLAALTFLPAEATALRTELAGAVVRGIAFLNRSQIRAGRLRGGVPRRVREFRDDVEDARERTLPGTVRIDYVQHAASAMLAYGELLGWFGDDSD